MKLSKEIITYGNDVLRETCVEVDEVTDEIKDIVKEMYYIMREGDGVGLAGPQVGLNLRLFTYDIGEGPHALINPKIVNKTGEKWGPEGCLSIPGLVGDVLRAERVVMTGLNEDGEKVRIRASGILAVVFQHETDHLDGILFVDKADPETLRIPSHDEDETDEETAEDE